MVTEGQPAETMGCNCFSVVLEDMFDDQSMASCPLLATRAAWQTLGPLP